MAGLESVLAQQLLQAAQVVSEQVDEELNVSVLDIFLFTIPSLFSIVSKLSVRLSSFNYLQHHIF